MEALLMEVLLLVDVGTKYSQIDAMQLEFELE